MMTSTFELKLPGRVHFGRGKLAVLREISEDRGWMRLAILTDEGVRQAGLLDRVLASIPEGVETVVFDQVEPEPPVECVGAALDALGGSDVDGVVALGGGSVMDVAKLVAVVLSSGRDVESLFGMNQVGARGLPTVMIPTTSGTGSEATGVAILTRSESGIKVGVADPAIVPDEAIVDPSLTDTLPKGPTAAAGIDALVHGVEAYIATVATPLAKGLAPKACAAVAAHLERVVDRPEDTEARDGMALGSHLAGMSFANSSCCAVHALALPLGGRYHIPHGVVTGGLFASVMAHNLPACEVEFRDLAEAMGWEVSGGAAFVERLDQLAERIGIQEKLRSYDVDEADLPELAREACAIDRLMNPNPQSVTEAEAEAIYRKALGR